MPRQEGTYKVGSNIELKANAPLDARLVVPVKSDLYSLEYYYQGMVVGVKAGGLYQLTGTDASIESHWSSVGGDSGAILEPRIAAIENGVADIKHTITAVDVESIFNNEFENPSTSYGSGYATGAYIRSEGTEFSSDWLSLEEGGTALTPKRGMPYLILSDGDLKGYLYMYDNNIYKHVGEAETYTPELFYPKDAPVASATLPELSPNTISGKWDTINFKNGVTLDRTDGYTGAKDNVNFTKALGVIRCTEVGEKITVNLRYDINAPIVANRRGIFIRINGTVLETLPLTNGVITEYNKEFTVTESMVGKDFHVFYGKWTSSTQNNNRTWLYGGMVSKNAPTMYYAYVSSSKLNMNNLVREIARATRQNTTGDESDASAVNTRADLYTLADTYRGMIVYVIDEDKYYKLVNDLPEYEASWIEVNIDGFVEITEAEIDAMFT